MADDALGPENVHSLPSQSSVNAVGIFVVGDVAPGIEAVGFLLRPGDELPPSSTVDWGTLRRVGFDGLPGQTVMLPQDGGPIAFFVGAGDQEGYFGARLRDAAACFGRASERFSRIAIVPGETAVNSPELAGQMLAEGVLLARYGYDELKPTSARTKLVTLDLVMPGGASSVIERGARKGEICARATTLVRDLVNSPRKHMTTTRFADIALQLGRGGGIAVEIFNRERLEALGCGGLLGVDAGSGNRPLMIKMTYLPRRFGRADRSHATSLALVGSGIMDDSGGAPLPRSDAPHRAAKGDMAGAAAVLGAMVTLTDLGCQTSVTGYLLCADNARSGASLRLGDILSLYGGTTVEVRNDESGGSLVVSDGLAVAAEAGPDAIIDIAPLASASLLALGPRTAAVLGNDQSLIDLVRTSAARTDEPVWQLPLETGYRAQLDSPVADLATGDGTYADATTAALLLNEFTDGIPWAHLDVAGTRSVDADDGWRAHGATGFGTRLLIDLILRFSPPSSEKKR